MSYEVPQPILNSPFDPPAEHWRIVEGEPPQRVSGRRQAIYWYRDPKTPADLSQPTGAGTAIEMKLVNAVRSRVAQWRAQGYPGVTRTTLELLRYWQRDGRAQRLFFAQVEAAETVIFMVEGRVDLRQGISVPRDEPASGGAGFQRYACKMATGAGKTTVMGMLAAWSILNKVNDRADARFSDAVLIVCPNVTIRDRLRELQPDLAEASLYRTRDLVGPHQMPLLTRGRVLVTNWHIFERHAIQVAGAPARVVKAGEAIKTRETIVIAEKATSARGNRYMTRETFEALRASGGVSVVDESGAPERYVIEATRYVESERAMVERVLGRELGRKGNLLVINDEAHHAYRIRQNNPDALDPGNELFDEEEESEAYEREATVWIEGLDRIQSRRGINFCLDLSATPYFLKSAGADTGRPFPWVVSDFGLIDAIESGLVKIPQLAVRDTTGAAIPGAFNIWRWVLQQLKPADRGGQRASPKPEAILKYAHHAIAMLAADWGREHDEWMAANPGGRPPVFILVCKNTKIAARLYEWIAEDKPPFGIPPARLPLLKNAEGAEVTIRVDSKVVAETDTGEAQSDKSRWMRFTLDTVGQSAWPVDKQGGVLYPTGFEDLAKKAERPLHPPGRDVRSIISVGMLTEGWDCRTVTHIIGLRPFMSQLLCEQVVGRGLRRASYEVGADGKFTEEVAKIFGVPFEIIPFKATPQSAIGKPARRHVHALPERAGFEIRFPRVEGYTQAVRNRVRADWDSIPVLRLEPERYAAHVQVKTYLPTDAGRVSFSGPGRAENLTLERFRATVRRQEVGFALATELTRRFAEGGGSGVPRHVLFPQVLAIAQRFLDTKVDAPEPTDVRDLILSPYYGQALERLVQGLRPDASAGEAPEIPIYERSRGPGSTSEVDFWTSRDVRAVERSHINFVVADTERWEQSAAFVLDTHPAVAAFAKNASLGFAIPYLRDGNTADYLPDFLVRLEGAELAHLVLEIKGFDPLAEQKQAAAERWVAAVNSDGRYGRWTYAMVKKIADVAGVLTKARAGLGRRSPGT